MVRCRASSRPQQQRTRGSARTLIPVRRVVDDAVRVEVQRVKLGQQRLVVDGLIHERVALREPAVEFWHAHRRRGWETECAQVA